MEEQEYKDTYQHVNQRRCVFEKSITSRRCSCEKSLRFHLADREGVSCNSTSCNALCTEFLNTMRRKARFALHLTSADSPLPHAKEIKVQTGGLLGLQTLLHPDRAEATDVNNAIGLVDSAMRQYGALDKLPYDLIVQAIVKFQGRKKRPREQDS
jgi:hypothetical protein